MSHDNEEKPRALAVMTVGACFGCDVENILNFHRKANGLDAAAAVDVFLGALAACLFYGIKPDGIEEALRLVNKSLAERISAALATGDMDSRATHHTPGHA